MIVFEEKNEKFRGKNEEILIFLQKPVLREKSL